jgi:hypothetical protein
VARGATSIVLTERWFSRLGLPFDGAEARLAAGYLDALGLPAAREIAVAKDWRDAEALIRDPLSAAPWWAEEEAERALLMRRTQQRIGSPLVFETLTSAVEGHAESTYAGALKASKGNEALAKVASGAALTAIHLRALALLAGCGEGHAFVQKYALFAAGRFPLGMRGPTFTFF